MIKGVHAMFYSDQADALRAFFRDKLGLPFTDVGDGWLIFDFKEGDMGVHPTDFPGSPPTGTHAISFYTDDIRKTVDQFKARGVRFTMDIEDHGFGFVTYFEMPGGIKVQLYQPKYSKKKPGAKKKPAAKKKAAARKKTPAKKKAARKKKR